VGVTAKQEHLRQPETQALMDLLQQTAPVLTVALHAGSLHVDIPYASGRGPEEGNKFVTADEEVRRHCRVNVEWEKCRHFLFHSWC
jgi:hypothetical protein